ncbi:hypothetical protein [Stenotrophomonas sp. PD6]|uniref:hypothetical protein n=1 Tax=Stenotrophomonas sp. PD6 TaxID=3368612 RepID=UPI003BA0DF3C
MECWQERVSAAKLSRTRRSKGAIWLLMAIGLPSLSSAQVNAGKWSIVDDLSYYRSVDAQSSNRGFSAFSACLASALQSARYRDAIAEVAASDCRAWVAVQVIEVNSSIYQFTFLCQNELEWSASGGSALDRHVYGSGQRPPVAQMNGLLERLALVKGEYDGDGYDVPCVYVTSFDGKDIRRLAFHSPWAMESSGGVEFSAAQLLVQEILQLTKAVREKWR